MPPLARSLAVALALSAALPGAALAQGGGQAPAPQPSPPAPPLIVQKPSPRGILIKEGWTNRFLLGGQWYFRQDDALVGDQSGFATQQDLTGWSPIRIPFNWNGQDTTQNRPSVGWYRKEFQVPKSKRKVSWKVRFQGNNYRSFVFLNGKPIGRFGGYFPFEVDLKGLRRGRNTLVVKVSSLRSSSDLTHWRPAAFNGFGTGGWWNFGGILREVYMRPVDTVDLEQVRALPKVGRLGGPARVRVKLVVRNMTRKKLRSAAIAIGIRRGPSTTIHRDLSPGRNELAASLTIQRPRLWQPGRPFLYGMRVGASTGGRRRSTYALAFGVKKLERRGSVALLNGHPLQLRGASIHEDDPVNGGALNSSNRSQIVRRMRELHATVARSHYPLHPATLEAFDRAGILDWTQTPVYQLPNALFNRRGVRSAAERAIDLTVRGNANHASIFVWSLVNEPAGNVTEFGKFGSGLRTYIRQGARKVKRLDDTRWVAIDHQSRLGEPLKQSAYRYLDVLGVNEYMGWYKSVKQGLRKPVFSSTKDLSPYLDRLHRANPRLPFFITEFGAEGSRHGPKGQKGSYEFQTQYTLDHLRIHGSKRYVNGSIVWALKDFRVDPTWLGGAPPEWATPPWHNKSLIEQSGQPKPVFGAIKRRWARTRAFRR
jgi:beta-galactosidase/beta-glucuronidase